MELKKKTIIWEDNNEPPKDYIWAKKDGKFYEYSYTQKAWIESTSISSGSNNDGGSGSGSGGGSGSMSMYDAWMKAFKTLQTDDFPVTPKKFAKGLIGSYVFRDQSAGSMFIPFINDSTSNIFVIYEEDLENILDIQDVPDDIYDDVYNSYYGYFLYDLDDLAQLNNLGAPLTALYDSYGMAVPYFYESQLTHWCTNILKFNGKNYVWFQDWD